MLRAGVIKRRRWIFLIQIHTEMEVLVSMTKTPDVFSELDLRSYWVGLRRNLVYLILVILLASVAAYFLSANQPKVFQARGYLMATSNTSVTRDLANTLVAAPALPSAAVELAMHSPDVVADIIKQINTDRNLPKLEGEDLIKRLNLSLQTDRAYPLNVITRAGSNNSDDLYEIVAQAGTAETARKFSNYALNALLSWDVSRATLNITRARRSLQQQLKETGRQLASPNVDQLERATLLSTRSDLTAQLARVTILETSALGALSRISSATTPLNPIEPRPLRQAATTGAITGALGLLFIGLLVANDRRLRNEDDLAGFGFPILAQIPKASQLDISRQGFIKVSQSEGPYEAIGFLRLNIMALLRDIPHPRILVASSIPGEGKSSIVAALAQGLGQSGQRVLIIDADLRRASQASIWRISTPIPEWQTALGEERNGEPARDTAAALHDSSWVQTYRVANNVDLLPAGAGKRGSLETLLDTDIGSFMTKLEQVYDILLIDSAPVLALADTLAIAPYTNSVIMVVAEGFVSRNTLKRSIGRLNDAGADVTGIVLNKVSKMNGADYHYYNYAYKPRGE